MTDLKLHDPIRPLISKGNMFYDPTSDSFGFITDGTPSRWLDEDFYMHADDADAFYDEIREATIVFEAGISIEYEGTMYDRLFVSYDSAKNYADTLSAHVGEVYIHALFLRD